LFILISKLLLLRYASDGAIYTVIAIAFTKTVLVGITFSGSYAQRVKTKHYSIALSVALLPDGCVAPYNYLE
jgi:hypothetical protein